MRSVGFYLLIVEKLGVDVLAFRWVEENNQNEREGVQKVLSFQIRARFHYFLILIRKNQIFNLGN